MYYRKSNLNDLISALPFFFKVLPYSAEPLGVQVLKSRGLFAEEYWYWLGVGAIIGFTLLFNFLFILSLTYLNRRFLSASLP